MYLSFSYCLPTVPPNSITQTSAGPSFPSTGMTETDSIQFLMALVMCGTTYIPLKQSRNLVISTLSIEERERKKSYECPTFVSSSPAQSFQDNLLCAPCQGQTDKTRRKRRLQFSF